MRDFGIVRGSVAVAAMWAVLAGAAWAQNGTGGGRGGAPPATPQTVPPSSVQDRIGEIESQQDDQTRIREQQEKARNDDRQKKLVADTQKLLELATELKTDVDKSNKDTLSLDVIKKADEIEKLAHSVKEKMKGS